MIQSYCITKKMALWKKIYILLFLSSIHNFFFLEIYFFKNEFIQSQNKQKKWRKKNFYQDSIFFLFSKKKQSSFNKNSRNIILKKSKERQRRISKKNKMNKMVKKRIKKNKNKNGRTRLFIDRWKQNKDYLKKECVSILQIL